MTAAHAQYTPRLRSLPPWTNLSAAISQPGVRQNQTSASTWASQWNPGATPTPWATGSFSVSENKQTTTSLFVCCPKSLHTTLLGYLPLPTCHLMYWNRRRISTTACSCVIKVDVSPNGQLVSSARIAGGDRRNVTASQLCRFVLKHPSQARCAVPFLHLSLHNARKLFLHHALCGGTWSCFPEIQHNARTRPQTESKTCIWVNNALSAGNHSRAPQTMRSLACRGQECSFSKLLINDP